MTLPTSITESTLYQRLVEDHELLAQLVQLRASTEALAATVARTVPSFTDHSIKHMDGLWRVADQVLTPLEVSKLTTGEAFLLAASFYLHDIGMAYAATEDGLKRCRESLHYQGFIASLPRQEAENPAMHAQALALAVRKLHASAAIELAVEPLPGTSAFLIEAKSFRDAWGLTCGRIAASHHWDLGQVEADFAASGISPLPGNRKGNLAYIAYMLRIIDYAHISRDRASSLERILRPTLNRTSEIHWLAQEHINGPERDGSELVYSTSKPIEDVEAWWLFYEMLVGLDAEIRGVQRFLRHHSHNDGRFSLHGVRGSGSPDEAARFIAPAEFLPIEVNLRTGSVERLVKLLAGESLYGPDPMAAVRELIQNSRDAVVLKSLTSNSEIDRAIMKLPIRVALSGDQTNRVLEVTDWGVGMNHKIMTDYLIAIASDYWTSQFHVDFPSAIESGFQHAGRFGIGFLSVFMLGDEICIESNRSGGERHQMLLHGVSRRGEMRTIQAQTGSGTSVRIHLKSEVIGKLDKLPELIRVYAPTLVHTVTVDVDGESTEIQAGWIFKLSSNEFKEWVDQAIKTLVVSRAGKRGKVHIPEFGIGWSNPMHEEDFWGDERPEYIDASTRLIADFSGTSLLCSNGLSLQPIRTPGFSGVIDLLSIEPDVSRRRALDADRTINELLVKARSSVKDKVIEQINRLAESGLILEKYQFLANCISCYGREVLRNSSLPWITQLKLPGVLELISSAELISRLSQKKTIFVAYHSDPWDAMKKWSKSGGIEKEELAVVLNNSDSMHLGYATETKFGSLSELFPDATKTLLFGSMIMNIAEAWQVNASALIAQGDWRHDRQAVWGKFSRS